MIRLILLHVAIILSMLVIVLFSGCSTTDDFVNMPRQPLVKQRLVVREAYPGLTNSRTIQEEGDKEPSLEVKSYDLEDAGVRRLLIDLQFRCMVGQKRYKICPDRAGFCRYECEKKWFGRRGKCSITSYIPLEPRIYHVESGTVCRSEKR